MASEHAAYCNHSNSSPSERPPSYALGANCSPPRDRLRNAVIRCVPPKGRTALHWQEVARHRRPHPPTFNFARIFTYRRCAANEFRDLLKLTYILPPPFVTCPYEALDGGWLMRPKSDATEQNRAHRRLPHFPGAGALRSGERALE